MPLSVPQLQALKQDITVTRAAVMWQGFTLMQSWNMGEHETTARFYDQPHASFWVWRSAVTQDEFTNDVGPEGTTFTWVGNGFITRAVGEHAAWNAIFGQSGFVNPARANIRQAFADIFSGPGNAAANRVHLLAIARRLANMGEALLATGAGTPAAPGTMTFEGQLTHIDVTAAKAV